MVGTVIPESIMLWIDHEIEQGEFTSVSEWIRTACREFYEKRKQDRQGGGALIVPDRVQKNFKVPGGLWLYGHFSIVFF